MVHHTARVNSLFSPGVEKQFFLTSRGQSSNAFCSSASAAPYVSLAPSSKILGTACAGNKKRLTRRRIAAIAVLEDSAKVRKKVSVAISEGISNRYQKVGYKIVSRYRTPHAMHQIKKEYPDACGDTGIKIMVCFTFFGHATK